MTSSGTTIRTKTVETVFSCRQFAITPLKRGVNENGFASATTIEMKSSRPLLSLTPRFSGVSERTPPIITVSTIFRDGDGVTPTASAVTKTVETVFSRRRFAITPLKRGVNENGFASTTTIEMKSTRPLLSLTPRFSGVSERTPPIITVLTVFPDSDGVTPTGSAVTKTVETVLGRGRFAITPLKRGVNENGASWATRCFGPKGDY
jgi:hypothetical protein